jgi:hypothetical protein
MKKKGCLAIGILFTIAVSCLFAGLFIALAPAATQGLNNGLISFKHPSTSSEPTPTLTNPSVSPSSGYTNTTFTYSVTYTDSGNNAPSYVYVYIDGYGYNMSKRNSADTNYTSGCVYYYSTYLSSASNTFYFYTSNGYNTAQTNGFSGPNVTASTVTLTDGSVTPETGTTSTYFTYWVTYTDSNNAAPTYIYVYVDDEGYFMSLQEGWDTTYSEGCVYMFTDYSSLVSNTIHTFYFVASDGSASATTATYYGPTVQGSGPTLDDWTASDGGNGQATFTVVYSDTNGYSPQNINVIVDGEEYAMNQQTSGYLDYVVGVTYTITLTLTTGSHSYYFEASDGQVTTTTMAEEVTITNNSGQSLSTTAGIVVLVVVAIVVPVAIARAAINNKKKSHSISVQPGSATARSTARPSFATGSLGGTPPTGPPARPPVAPPGGGTPARSPFPPVVPPPSGHEVITPQVAPKTFLMARRLIEASRMVLPGGAMDDPAAIERRFQQQVAAILGRPMPSAVPSSGPTQSVLTPAGAGIGSEPAHMTPDASKTAIAAVKKPITPEDVEAEDTVMAGLGIRELDGYLLRRSQGHSPGEAMSCITEFGRAFRHVRDLDSFLACLIRAQSSGQ